MDETHLRARVNHLLREVGERQITPEEMKHALRQGWIGDYDLATEEADLAELIAEHCREWRSAPTPQRVISAPEQREGRSEASDKELAEPVWWVLGESEIWQRHEPLRREMLALFNRLDAEGEPEALDPEEMTSIIDEVARGARQEGDWRLLEVPLGWRENAFLSTSDEPLYGLASEVRVVWRGFHRPPPIDSDGSLREPTAAERAAEQKLFRLAEAAQKVADQTGCLCDEAVVYLLGGERPFLPYVDVTIDPRYAGYVIIVRDRRIPVSDVAAFYRDRRDSFGPLTRQPKESPYLVVQFVEEAKAQDPSLKWTQLYELFAAENPGRYVSMTSFRQTYYSKRPKPQGK